MTFEEWFDTASWASERTLAQAAYLAGQASAEQRVKELEGDCAILRHAYAEQLKAQAGEPIYGMAQQRQLNPSPQVRSDVGSLGNTHPTTEQAKILHDNKWELYERSPTTERPYNPLNDYAVIPMNPTTEPVKAQAGEPVAWMKTNGGNGNEKVFISAHMKQRGYDDFDVPLFTHPTTERPYNPLNDYAVIPMPTTERRVIPEDVRKVMEMALEVLEYHIIQSPTGKGSKEATALRNALNAAPAKGEV